MASRLKPNARDGSTRLDANDRTTVGYFIHNELNIGRLDAQDPARFENAALHPKADPPPSHRVFAQRGDWRGGAGPLPRNGKRVAPSLLFLPWATTTVDSPPNSRRPACFPSLLHGAALPSSSPSVVAQREGRGRAARGGRDPG
eukprot:5580649-Pyramimonas_sp.AAC.1